MDDDLNGNRNVLQGNGNKAADEQALIGIRLSHILDVFVPQHRDSLAGLTTSEVIENIIKPLTRDKSCSYCDLVKTTIDDESSNGFEDVVGDQPEAFISHAHQYKFLEILNALEEHLNVDGDDGGRDMMIFFDLFCINQHRTSWSYDWLTETFSSSISTIGRTIMVMSPWDDPITFTRTWCIYEVYSTARSGATFEIALSVNDKQTFLNQMLKDVDAGIARMQANISSKRSQCMDAIDREKIFRIIEENIGFSQLDSLLFEKYRKWVIKVSEEALKSSIYLNGVDDLKTQGWRHTVGSLYFLQGTYDRALPLLETCWNRRKVLLGEKHPATLDSKSRLALLYRKQGNYEEARGLYEQCLNSSRRDLGEDSPRTLKCMYQLGKLYNSQGKYASAQDMYERSLERRQATLGGFHPDTLDSMTALAKLYQNQAKYEKAQHLYEECLQRTTEALGENHPSSLETMSKLAQLSYQQGELLRSQFLNEICLERRKNSLGSDHPDTLVSINQLGLLYDHLGKYEHALSLQKECLERRRRILGEDHPHTLTSIHNLALLYDHKGDDDQAGELYETVVELRKSVLGPNHPRTLTSMFHFGLWHFREGDRVKGLELLEDCAKKRKQSLGPDHIDTRDVNMFLMQTNSID